jgi:GT2 family glycosyltransferase
MKIYVIIPVLNEAEAIGRVLSEIPDWVRQVVVVDNGGLDGVPEMLAGIARRDGRVKVIANAENRGFAGANNQGIRAATGEIVVMLNNDTVVPPHWLARLVAPLGADPGLGLVGAVTNRIGNAAEIPTSYRDLGGMERLAAERAGTFGAAVRDIPMVALFCAAAWLRFRARLGSWTRTGLR